MKAEKDFGPNFFWILAGVPKDGQQAEFEYYIIPSKDMAHEVTKAHKAWLNAPGKNGRPHADSKVRTVTLPPKKGFCAWSIEKYRNRWDLIAAKLSQR